MNNATQATQATRGINWLPIILGVMIFAYNLLMGFNRLASYKHSTNCVTKGMSNLYHDVRGIHTAIFSYMAIAFLGLLTLICKWQPVGLLIAVVSLFIPSIFKMIQAKDRDYVKNQRRFTKGGLQVGAKSMEAVGTVAGGAAAGYATGGAATVQGAAAGKAIGKAIGSVFGKAAENMTDVDLKHDVGPDEESVKALNNAAAMGVAVMAEGATGAMDALKSLTSPQPQSLPEPQTPASQAIEAPQVITKDMSKEERIAASRAIHQKQKEEREAKKQAKKEAVADTVDKVKNIDKSEALRKMREGTAKAVELSTGAIGLANTLSSKVNPESRAAHAIQRSQSVLTKVNKVATFTDSVFNASSPEECETILRNFLKKTGFDTENVDGAPIDRVVNAIIANPSLPDGKHPLYKVYAAQGMDDTQIALQIASVSLDRSGHLEETAQKKDETIIDVDPSELREINDSVVERAKQIQSETKPEESTEDESPKDRLRRMRSAQKCEV